MCFLQETHFSLKDTCELKVRGYKRIAHTSGNQQKAEWLSLYPTKKTLSQNW